MLGKIIGCFCSVLCAFPFFAFPAALKNTSTPISFWSGDNSLKEKITDVKAYNREMALLYRAYAIAFLVQAVAFLFSPMAGVVLLCVNCTVSIYIVYRRYKAILRRYSQ